MITRAIAASTLVLCAGLAQAQQLTGFAVLPANTFAAGPVSGQFITGANGITTPFASQPVQGFSGILRNTDGTFTVLCDNGYGARNNSADFVLRLYNMSIDPRRVGPGGVTGSGSVTVNSFISLSDPDNRLGYTAVADGANYPNGGNNIPVDPSIVSGRLLTGSDLDIESLRRGNDGSYYIGDEFGPFVAHFDTQGRLLSAPVATPGNVVSPSNPFGLPATHPGSGGYEGMSQSADGRFLYAMLERPTNADLAAGRNRLQINTFDTQTNTFNGEQRFYPLSVAQGGTNIGDFSPVTNDVHLVIERDNGQGSSAAFKKVFLVDFNTVDAAGNLVKVELLDLLNIPDPNDLNGDGSLVMTFPFVTIEDIILLNDRTIAILNDNNFPFSAGRTPGVADNNEYIEVSFDRPIASFIPAPGAASGLALLGVAALRRRRA